MNGLRLLCAGAGHGVVAKLEARWTRVAGRAIDARFGPVGMLKEALLGGAPCDVFVASEAIVDALAAAGELDAGSRARFGAVATGLAVRRGAATPRVVDAASLRAALLAADRVFFPDPERATAGIHFAAVLRKLELTDVLAQRLSTHPSGAAAMQALAASADAAPIGCTQLSEILDTPGVQSIGALPKGYALTTTYAAAICARTSEPEAARRFIELLTGSDAAALRAACGFEG